MPRQPPPPNVQLDTENVLNSPIIKLKNTLHYQPQVDMPISPKQAIRPPYRRPPATPTTPLGPVDITKTDSKLALYSTDQSNIATSNATGEEHGRARPLSLNKDMYEDKIDVASPSPAMPESTSPEHRTQPSKHHHKVHKRRSIGDWDFEESIGAGSMGQVRLARNRYTGEQCAVKVIPKGHIDKKKGDKPPKESEESKNIRSVREASIGRLLHHKNICRLYEVYSMSNHFYLLFEYVSGGQMLDYIISHGSLKEKHARKFARSIASALDYCHHNSIVHRDLKIENIMISDSGEIKIIDFGLSNLFRHDSLLKTFCGSLYFAAPELLNAQPYIGPEVDVWSFGIVLYVLVCGKVPFDDQSMPALHEKIKKGKVEYPHWLSSSCKDLLQKILVVEPKSRITLHQVMRHPWMCKGYDGPAESHVPKRNPICSPLDSRIIQQMSRFEFGKEEDIENALNNIMNDPKYLAAVKAWNKVILPRESTPNPISGSMSSMSSRNSTTNANMSPTLSNSSSTTFSGASPGDHKDHSHMRHLTLDLNRFRSIGLNDGSEDSDFIFHHHHRHHHEMDQFEQIREALGDFSDPTDAYHPLLSIYYLVSEDMKRRAASEELRQKQLNKNTGEISRSSSGSNRSAQNWSSSGVGMTPGAPTPSQSKITRSSSQKVGPVSSIGTPETSNVVSTPNRRSHVPEYETPMVTRPDPVHAIDHGLPELETSLLNEETGKTNAEHRVSAPGSGTRYRRSEVEYNHGATSPLQNPFASYNGSPVDGSFEQNRETPQRHASTGKRLIRRHKVRHSEPQNIIESPPPPTRSSFAGSILRRLSVSRRKSNTRLVPDNPPSSPLARSARRYPLSDEPNSPPPPLPELPDGKDYSSDKQSVEDNQSENQETAGRTSNELNPLDIRMENLNLNSPAAKTRKTQYHPSARAKSVGHARRESTVFRYYQSEKNESQDVPDEGGSSGDIASNRSSQKPQTYIDNEQMPSIQYPKQVFLKGFFSVQSTSTKSLPFIRSDIMRVLDHLGITYREIKGGFLCYHRPSVRTSFEDDYRTNGGLSPGNSTLSPPSSPLSPGHWRKLSFGSGAARRRSGIFGSSSNESNTNVGESDDSNMSLNHQEGSDMLGYGTNNVKKGPTALRFEISIVKVPLLTLHGIQFKKLAGNSWQYKSLATKILSELRL